MAKAAAQFRPSADPPILAAFARYHVLTAEQLRRLRFGRDIGYVRNNLARLRDAGYLNGESFLPRRSPTGGAARVFQLATKGRAWLHEQGYPVSLKALQIRRDYPLEHTHSVNDFLIAVELMARANPHVTLEAMRHEIDLKKQPFVTTVEGKRLVYTPDGWIHLSVEVNGRRYQGRYALEIDRGTEDQRRFREKIRALLAWKHEAYEQEFHSNNLTVAVVSVCGDNQADTNDARAKRITNLKRWTEAELPAAGSRDDTPWFRFIGVDPARVEPERLFFSPIWSGPSSAESVPLLVRAETVAPTAS